jgi:putative ABC transport system permease protein
MSIRRLWQTIRLGLKSLLAHRLRSSLTVLGVILGVGSVIVMLAVGEAARFQAVQQIRDLGATNLIVRSVKPAESGKDRQSEGRIAYGLTRGDMERIRLTIPTVSGVTPLREFRKQVNHLDHRMEARIVAVMPNFLAGNGLHLSHGRFINDIDNERYANVAVLASETAEMLFPFEDPIGRTVCIDGTHFYNVIGVMESKAPSAGIGGSIAAQDYNRDIYIPFLSDRARFGKTLTYYRTGVWSMEELEMSQLTVEVDDMKHVKQTAKVIEGLLDQFHSQKDTSITIPLDLLEKAEQAQRLFTLVLGAIASVSLVVGGIGIMNIMLATVTERTREIGIRMAVGAKRRDIAWQFLVETMSLSGAGGLMGVALGIACSGLVTRVFTFPTIIRPWSPMMAFAVSLAVGLIFGTYPAIRAASLDPIEALRYE